MRKKVFSGMLASLMIIAACLCTFVFYGCGDGGFKPVSTVRIVINSHSLTIAPTVETFNSTVNYISHGYADIKTITEEEWNNAPEDRRLTTPFNLIDKYNIKDDYKIPKEFKGKTVYTVPFTAEELENDWIYVKDKADRNLYRYYKTRSSERKYYIVYVKEVNDHTLIIKNHNGEETFDDLKSFTVTYLSYE